MTRAGLCLRRIDPVLCDLGAGFLADQPPGPYSLQDATNFRALLAGQAGEVEHWAARLVA